MYLGDIALGQELNFKYTSRDSTGTPSTLSGANLLVLYRDNSTSEFSQGLSLTTDFDSVVGLNHVRVVTSSATQFPSGHDYQISHRFGQVSGITIVGEVVAQFSISNRYGGALFMGPLSGVPSTSQVSLPSVASTTNDLYLGAMLVATEGPGNGQSRFISDYTGAGLFAQLDSVVGTALTSATTVVIYPGAPSVPGSVNSLVPGNYSGVTVGVSGIDPASVVSSNVQFVNKVTVEGLGTDAEPWKATGT